MKFLIICKYNKKALLIKQKLSSLYKVSTIYLQQKCNEMLQYDTFSAVFIDESNLNLLQIVDGENFLRTKIIILGDFDYCNNYLFYFHPYYYIRNEFFYLDLDKVLYCLKCDITYFNNLLPNTISFRNNLIYIEKEENIAVFHFHNTIYQKRISLKTIEFMEWYKDDFLRIHNSYIINTNFIDEMNSKYVKINGLYFPIGRKYYESVKKKFDYLKFKE